MTIDPDERGSAPPNDPMAPLAWALTRLGAHLSAGQVRKLDAILDFLETGRWLRARGLEPRRRSRNRQQLWEQLADPLADRPVLFLEFGVFRGESMRWWSGQLRHPDTRLHGFDSFVGLPEDFKAQYPQGSLDVGGATPAIDDDRIAWHAGWFDDTVPAFSVPPHDQLVLHLDCDLYSSTRCVLQALAPHLRPGTIFIFDEFFNRNHELRAFDEHINATGGRYRCLGATLPLDTVAFQQV